jgi:hypothetical protein
MSDEKTCPDLPFSEDVMRAYYQWLNASKEERGLMCLEFASIFASEHDNLDDALSDEYHSFFEEYWRAQLDFETNAAKLCRLAALRIRDFLEVNHIEINSVGEKVPTSN